jgi:hypothetical protein
MLNKYEDQFYERHGLEKPLHLPHFTEEERERFKVQANHQWKQRGNELYCVCEIGEHTSLIPTNKILQGTDDSGKPIFANVKV